MFRVHFASGGQDGPQKGIFLYQISLFESSLEGRRLFSETARLFSEDIQVLSINNFSTKIHSFCRKKLKTFLWIRIEQDPDSTKKPGSGSVLLLLLLYVVTLIRGPRQSVLSHAKCPISLQRGVCKAKTYAKLCVQFA